MPRSGMPTLRARCAAALFDQHLGVDTASLDDRVALQMFRDIARANRDRLGRQAPDWQGLVFALTPETYGFKSGVKSDLT